MSQPESLISGTVGTVVVAAGASTRMGGLDKVFADLGGTPVVAHSLRVLEASPAISRIVLVLSGINLERGLEMVSKFGWSKVTKVCAGGARRQDSVSAGLSNLDGCDWVLVHDGARPFIDEVLIERGLHAVQRWGAAIPGVPIKDTIKVVRDGIVEGTLDRNSLIAVQTPQFFKSAIIREAYAKFGDDATDDAALVERLGQKVGVFQGSYMNMKITTPEDLAVARCYLGQQSRES